MRWWITGAMSLAAAGVLASAEVPDFARYNVIIERRPFGEPESAAGGGAGGVPAAPPFTKDIKMCAITESEDGVMVGFVNIAVQPPRNYYLRVGEKTEDAIEVAEANYKNQSALFRRGTEEYWVSMDGSTNGSAPASGGRLSATPLIASAPASVASTGAAPMSYAERMRKRREAIRLRQVEDNPKLTGEKLEQHLKEYQMELIRKGQPPLPMPLTQDMDDQLVSEGVLPPAGAAASAPAPADTTADE